MPKIRETQRERMLKDPEFQFKYEQLKEKYGLRMTMKQVAEFKGCKIDKARNWLKDLMCTSLDNGKKIWWSYDVLLKDCEEMRYVA